MCHFLLFFFTICIQSFIYSLKRCHSFKHRLVTECITFDLIILVETVTLLIVHFKTNYNYGFKWLT